MMIYDRPIVLTLDLDGAGEPIPAPFGSGKMYTHEPFRRLSEAGVWEAIPAGRVDLGGLFPKGLIDQEQAVHDHFWRMAKNKDDVLKADKMFRRDLMYAENIWPWARPMFAYGVYFAIRALVGTRDFINKFRQADF